MISIYNDRNNNLISKIIKINQTDGMDLVFAIRVIHQN